MQSLSAAPLNWSIAMRPEMLMETNFSRFLVHLFRAQALLDLGLGVIFYRHVPEPSRSRCRRVWVLGPRR